MAATDIRPPQTDLTEAELTGYRKALDIASRLPVSLRINLAQAVLQSLHQELPPPRVPTDELTDNLPAEHDTVEEVRAILHSGASPDEMRKMFTARFRPGTLEEAQELLRSDEPPPDDEEVRRIIEQERMRRYGL